MERETGLEPATTCLEGRNSTTELLPQTQIHVDFTLKQVGKQAGDFLQRDLSPLRLFSLLTGGGTIILVKCSMTSGSNWEPEQRCSSSSACWLDSWSRYGRGEVMGIEGIGN